MKTRSTAGLIGIVITSALLLLGNTSCSKSNKALGTFYVKGRFLNTSGTPKANMEVHMECTWKGSYLGGKTTRETTGSTTTDSLGYFVVASTLYGSGDYKIEPPGYYVPQQGDNDTIDLGTNKW